MLFCFSNVLFLWLDSLQVCILTLVFLKQINFGVFFVYFFINSPYLFCFLPSLGSLLWFALQLLSHFVTCMCNYAFSSEYSSDRFLYGSYLGDASVDQLWLFTSPFPTGYSLQPPPFLQHLYILPHLGLRRYSSLPGKPLMCWRLAPSGGSEHLESR